MDFSKDYEQTILDAFSYLKRKNWVENKDWGVGDQRHHGRKAD